MLYTEAMLQVLDCEYKGSALLYRVTNRQECVQRCHAQLESVTSRASMVEMKGLPCLSVDVVIALKKRLRRSLASKAGTPTPALSRGRVSQPHYIPQRHVHTLLACVCRLERQG